MEQSAPDGIHGWNPTGITSQHTDRCGCYLEGPWQAKEMGWPDLHEDQSFQIYGASHTITPCINKGQGKLAGRKVGLQKKPLGLVLTGNLNVSHQCALVAMSTNCTLAARVEPAGTGEGILPTNQDMWVHIWTMSSLITSSTRLANWGKSSGGPPRWLGNSSTWCARRGWVTWVCPVWEEKAWWVS